jgi:hypothetical protein
MKKYVNIFLILLLLLIAHPARADGHGKAVIGTILGGVLIGVGATSLSTDIGTCSTPAMINCWKIPLDILEIVGGVMAMSQNSQAAAQTAPTGGLNGFPKLNLPPGTLPPDIKIPNPGVIYFTKNPDGTPNPQFPSKDELKRLIQSGFVNGNVAPDGSTLEDALAKLNDNYDKAKDAVIAYNNQQALSGDDPNSGTQIASSNGQGNASDDYVGLNTGSGLNSNNDSNNDIGLDGIDTNRLSPSPSNADLDALKKNRGDFSRVKIIGMNTEDQSGKALSIFERVSRAIRGERNRDLTLAKIEWARKEAFNRQKIPTKTAPKISVSKDLKSNRTNNHI